MNGPRLSPGLIVIALAAAVGSASAAAAPAGGDAPAPPPPLEGVPDDGDGGPADAPRDRRDRLDDDDDGDDWRRKRRERRMKRRRAVEEEEAVPSPNLITGDDLLVAAGQTATGAGVCALSLLMPWVCAIVPFASLVIGPFSLAVMCFGMPLFSSLSQVALGDALGTKRGVLAWPFAAHVAYQIAITSVAGILGFVGVLLVLAALIVLDGGNLSPATTSTTGLYGMAAALGGVGLVHAAATIAGNALPAVIYLFTAEPKLEDDPDFRLPGLFEPAHAASDLGRRRTGHGEVRAAAQAMMF